MPLIDVVAMEERLISYGELARLGSSCHRQGRLYGPIGAEPQRLPVCVNSPACSDLQKHQSRFVTVGGFHGPGFAAGV